MTYVLPSSAGEPNRGQKDGLTLAGVVRPQRATRPPFRVVFDRTEYLVGPNVGDFAEPIDRLDFDRFKESPELRATFYAAIYKVLPYFGGVGWSENTSSASMGWRRP